MEVNLLAFRLYLTRTQIPKLFLFSQGTSLTHFAKALGVPCTTHSHRISGAHAYKGQRKDLLYPHLKTMKLKPRTDVQAYPSQ